LRGNVLKKILFFLFFCFIFSFAQETLQDSEEPADTLPSDTISIEIPEIEENIDELEELEIPETEEIEKNIDELKELEIPEIELEEDETMASLTIITTPDSATVLLNRRRLGLSPISVFELEPEEYSVMVLKEGYELFDTTITLRAGQNDTLQVNFSSEKTEESTLKSEDESENEAEAEKSEEAELTNNELSEEELAKKKKRTDMIGIIVFLSVMLAFAVRQEVQ
jgi:hypothetical protein